MDFDKLRKKFGMQKDKKERTIVNNLTAVPKVDTPINTPNTEVFDNNSTHQIDLIMMPHDEGYKYILVCVDLASRNVGAEPLKDKTAAQCLKALLQIYKTSKFLKMPEILEMDPGSEFKGEFEKYFLSKNVTMKYKKTGRHRSQAVVETFNGMIGRALNKRMLADEISTNEISVNWVDDLQDLVKLLNHIIASKKRKPNSIRDKLSHHGMAPVAEGDARDMLSVGTKVRIILDEPRNIQGTKLHGTFRNGDIRWEVQPRTIVFLSLRPNQPPMYMVSGINNAAYTKNQLQVVSENERPPPVEAVKKFVIDKIVGKRILKGKPQYLIHWKNFDKSNDSWEPASEIPKSIIDDYVN
jgi:hypothetical protein